MSRNQIWQQAQHAHACRAPPNPARPLRREASMACPMSRGDHAGSGTHILHGPRREAAAGSCTSGGMPPAAAMTAWLAWRLPGWHGCRQPESISHRPLGNACRPSHPAAAAAAGRRLRKCWLLLKRLLLHLASAPIGLLLSSCPGGPPPAAAAAAWGVGCSARPLPPPSGQVRGGGRPPPAPPATALRLGRGWDGDSPDSPAPCQPCPSPQHVGMPQRMHSTGKRQEPHVELAPVTMST